MVYMINFWTGLKIFCVRTQYVNVGGKRWEDVAVTSGVPLGRVLGPTLFISFITVSNISHMPEF